MPGTARADQPEPAAPAAADRGAELFLTRCTGCHTVGHGDLIGPDLAAVSPWPADDLRAAITRMEAKVGPMPPDEIEALRQLLQSADVAERLAREGERVAQREAASLAAPSAAVGRELFEGSRPLENGGAACMACHRVAGHGGTLAADLTDVFTRLGEAGLRSACEKTPFPVMRTIYARHPITRQEAMHLTSFFETQAGRARAGRGFPVTAAGWGGAAVILAGIVMGYRGRNRGTRRQLVRGFHRR
jgi:cytochrome c2